MLPVRRQATDLIENKTVTALTALTAFFEKGCGHNRRHHTDVVGTIGRLRKCDVTFCMISRKKHISISHRPMVGQM